MKNRWIVSIVMTFMLVGGAVLIHGCGSSATGGASVNLSLKLNP